MSVGCIYAAPVVEVQSHVSPAFNMLVGLHTSLLAAALYHAFFWMPLKGLVLVHAFLETVEGLMLVHAFSGCTERSSASACESDLGLAPPSQYIASTDTSLMMHDLHHTVMHNLNSL